MSVDITTTMPVDVTTMPVDVTTMPTDSNFVTQVTPMYEGSEADALRTELIRVQQKAKELEVRNKELETLLEQKDQVLHKFLADDQIRALEMGHILWSSETVLKALKLRIVLGKDGIDTLRETGYPLPSYSTIMRRISSLNLNFGFFESLVTPLSEKVKNIENRGRFCVLSFDEMEIEKVFSFDKNRAEMYGTATLGNTTLIANKLLLVLVRSWHDDWKQIVAAHLTTVTTEGVVMKKFILHCVDQLESIGLSIVAISSDAGNNNLNLWKSLGCRVSRTKRQYTFLHNNHKIYIIVDACHALKNLVLAMMNNEIILPSNEIVSGIWVEELWQFEKATRKKVRKLYHLKWKHFHPNGYEKMKVGPAVRFFSDQTAAALEDAVRHGILPDDALPTATFIRIVAKWFSLMAAKHEFALTKENAVEELHFLQCVVQIFQETKIGSCWKPSNTNIITSTLSMIDLCQMFFENDFQAVVTHKGTTDALENVNSQVRRRAGSMPTAKKCLDALKLITVGQFVSEIKNSNYSHDSDIFLLNFIKERSKTRQHRFYDSSFLPQDESLEFVDFSDAVDRICKYDLSTLYYIAGSTTRAMLKRKFCVMCQQFLRTEGQNNLIDEVKRFTQSINRGQLLFANELVFLLIINCFSLVSHYETAIVENTSERKQALVDRIAYDLDPFIPFPPCCNLQYAIILHYFNVHAFAFTGFSENVLEEHLIYGTASSKAHK